MPTSATNGSHRNTTGLKQTRKYSWCAMCAQKPTARCLNHRCRKQRQKYAQAKRVGVQKIPRTPDNGNTSATSFAFTMETICKLFRRNRRGSCSSFLFRKPPPDDDTIA